MMPTTVRASLLRLVRRTPCLLALPCVAVMVAVLVAVAGRPWHLTGDYAHTELLVRAVPSHPPLIGVAARVRGNGSTPGPSMAYALAPAYWLLGGGAHALAFSVMVLHATAIAATVHLVARRAGVGAAAAFAAAFLLVVVALGPGFFLEPWNVWVPLFALPLLMVLVWEVVLGRDLLLIPAAIVGSHCVQTHVGYAVIAGGLVAAAAATVVARLVRRRLSRRVPAIALSGGTVALFAMWLPPLIEQARPGTGNLRKVLEQFLDPQQPAVGFAAAGRAVAARMNLVGMWHASTAGDARAGFNAAGFIAFVAVVVVAITLTVQRRDRLAVSWLGVLSATTVLGFVSAARVFGTFFEYVVRWMVPLAGLWVATAAWAVLAAASQPHDGTQSRRRTLRSAMVPALCVAGLSMTAVGVTRASAAQVPHRRDSDLVAALAAQLDGPLRGRLAAGERLQLNEVDLVSLGSVSFGLVVEFDRGAGRLGVGEWGRAGVMAYRVVGPEADGALWLVSSLRMIDHFAALSGAHVLAIADVRTPAEVERSGALERELVERLCTLGRGDALLRLSSRWGYTVLVLDPSLPDEVRGLVSKLIELRQVTAVIELPVGTDGFAEVVPPPECPA